ncbi:CHAT domain-containing protein, partial [bacterium]
EALSKQSPEEERVDALAERLKRAEDARQELERTIRANHRRYAEVRYPPPLDLQGIQASLDPDWVLLEYSLSEEGSYLFLVTRDGLEVHPLPRTREIASHMERVRAGVASPGRLGGYVRSARWLYEELVAPVRPRLDGKQILLIAADGPLHFLSFEALLTADVQGSDPAGFPYLLRDFALGYVPSASVLPLLSAAKTRESKAAKQLVAFADPVYGSGSSGVADSGALTRGAVGERPALQGLSRLRRLRGSGLEVERIAGLYRPDDVMIYMGEDANERHIKRNALVETARRLHFAAHGVLNAERPALSGLRLSKSEGDDGLLQVYEIFNLKLEAELVVLSACESGLGREVTGEGLVGVTRAFLYAGAPSVVVSLWRVRDDTAPDLMLDFYQGLNQLGKAEALRQAKLTMIGAGRHSHPYYWAPFVLVGKP